MIILCDHNPTISHAGDEVSLYSTMATSYRKLDEFNPKIGYNILNEWNTTYFLANVITSAKQQWAVLRSVIGTKAYRILTLLPPPGASTAFIANQ